MKFLIHSVPTERAVRRYRRAGKLPTAAEQKSIERTIAELTEETGKLRALLIMSKSRKRK